MFLANKCDIDLTEIRKTNSEKYTHFRSQLDLFHHQLTSSKRFATAAYSISVKNCVNFEESMIQFFRFITQDPNLEFVTYCTAGPPPDVVLTQAQIDGITDELANCSSLPLPDDDDDL
jgi:hypothetical protein